MKDCNTAEPRRNAAGSHLSNRGFSLSNEDRSWRSTRRKCTRRRQPSTLDDAREIVPPAVGPFSTTRLKEPRRMNPRNPKLNSSSRPLRVHPFTSKRFHVLLNSLFKVLFNFPSRYLSAIGLVSVFSLRWSLPPALGCIPKQPDSRGVRMRPDLECVNQKKQRPCTCSGGRKRGPDHKDLCTLTSSHSDRPKHHSSRTADVHTKSMTAGIRCWALPASLAVTEGILVSFFSSAY